MRGILLAVTFLACTAAHSQGLLIRQGTSFKTSGGVNIVSNNANIINNGDFSGANVIFVGTGVTKASGMVVKDLSINKTSGSLQLQSNIFVNGQVNIVNGMIDLNGQRLNLSPASVIIGESELNRIKGSGDVSITVNLNAPSAANPGNLGLLVSSFANLGATTVRRGHDALTPNSIKRFYEVIPANNTNLGASIKFQYFDAELNNLNENFLTMVKKSGSSFPNIGNDGSSNAFNFVGKNNLTELGIFTLVGPANSLPVKFVLFNSSCENNGIKLTWKTAAEVNSKQFDVERTMDGLNWQVIASLPASGNSNVEKTYSYTDNAISGGLYRIVEQDVSGQKNFTAVIRPSCNVVEQFKVWPNPVSSLANISFQSMQSGDASISITDAKGSIVQKQRKGILAGVNQVQIDMGKLPAGMYTVTVSWGNNVREAKVIKK